MHVFSPKVIVALLLAVGIERALAYPTSDPAADLLRVRATEPGDDIEHPHLKEFDCTDTDADHEGIQELFDADCFAHLCLGMPVTMNRWNQQSRNRGVQYGNGVGSRPIFQDTKKYHTKRPGDGYISPEEWPPASTAQGGLTAVLFPVTQAAQNRQKTLINNKFYAKAPVVAVQKGLDGSKKGSWFRITKWDGAKGPYCKSLNGLLEHYADNFNAQGNLKSEKVPDICTKKGIDLNGLKYDVGEYAYQLNPEDTKQYFAVGKPTS